MTAKLVDDLTDTHSNKTRESWGQGVANVASGFFGGMDGCAMTGTEDRAQLLDRLRRFHEAATARVTALREQLTVADGFADSLAGHLDARR